MEEETDVETGDEGYEGAMDLDEDNDEDDGSVEMGIAKTYENTIVQLNAVLGGDVFDVGSA